MEREELDYLNKISNIVIGAAIEVHKELGPGLLETVYEECLKTELTSKGVKAESRVSLPLKYKGVDTGKVFKIDLLVEDKLIVEIKAVEEMKTVHEIQLVTYMKLADKHMGLLINFNVPVLKHGIKRKINGYVEYHGIRPERL